MSALAMRSPETLRGAFRVDPAAIQPGDRSLVAIIFRGVLSNSGSMPANDPVTIDLHVKMDVFIGGAFFRTARTPTLMVQGFENLDVSPFVFVSEFDGIGNVTATAFLIEGVDPAGDPVVTATIESGVIGRVEDPGVPVLEASEPSMAYEGLEPHASAVVGGPLPIMVETGWWWFFNVGLGVSGPNGLVRVYVRVGQGVAFNMVDSWEAASRAIFITHDGFGGIGTSVGPHFIPLVPAGTYDAEAEVWWFPATLEEAHQQTATDDFIPKTLAGAQASADGVFLSRLRTPAVFQIDPFVLPAALSVGVRTLWVTAIGDFIGEIVGGPFPSSFPGECRWDVKLMASQVFRLEGRDLEIVGGAATGPFCGG